ncbi:oligoendopeptidase F [Lacticaseibacillus sp. N501-2]|uniref:oligoendopeptidase F n=1 Tax=Lacticaseibacillus salsurae TaxID=3367729 RepID=UPI0038B38170
MSMLPNRNNVPTELTWDLTTIFKSDADWQNAFDQAANAGAQAAKWQGRLGASAQNLADGLAAILQAYRQIEKVYVYASLKSDQDTANATYSGFSAQAQSLWTQISAQTAFMQPEILAIAPKTLTQWLQTPELQLYQQFINTMVAQREHVLSADQEALIAAAGDALNASSATFNVLNNADLQFGEILDEQGNAVQLSHGTYGELIKSTKRSVRQAAFESLYATYGKFQHTFAQTLAGEIKKHTFDAKVHHYASARAQAMADNQIPETVYDTLVATVNAHLPSLQRYLAFRQALLGLDELHMYDLYTPLNGKPPVSYTIDEAKAVALKALAPLGEDYLSHVQAIFDHRMIDVVENQNKRSGAYSGGSYDTDPFILLNWQDSIDALFTLVHETGHSVHSWYTRHNQPYVYGDYSIFVAEIASTTNENLLTDYLLRTQKDPAVQAYVLNYYLDGFKGTVYRQTQFAEFEHWLHQQDQAGQALTAEALNQQYAKLNAHYYQGVVQDPQIALEWTRIPHFYYDYYVYQYATGFAAASTLAAGISAHQPHAVDHYLNYLKSGSSQTPLDTMKAAGVDMTKPDYLESAFAVFDQRLAQLTALLDQKG